MDHRKNIQESYKRIQPFIHKTPVLTSSGLNAIAGANMFFKCENFQKMGAFKMRGATNAILQLTNEQRLKGVVTHSSGNFAQALSLAAKNIGVKAYIVMPDNVPKVKLEAVNAYHGMVTICESNLEARQNATKKIIQNIGASFIHPSNNLDVIYGNATTCLELLDDFPNMDCVIAPVGGGGLLAGTALSAYYFGNNCDAYGAEPLAADDAYRSILSGKIESNTTTNTIADGLRTQLGTINFPIIQRYVKQIIRVEETTIISAMQFLFERLKIVVEPSSAIALAAVLNNKKIFANKNIGVILSGGNVDLQQLPF